MKVFIIAVLLSIALAAPHTTQLFNAYKTKAERKFHFEMVKAIVEGKVGNAALNRVLAAGGVTPDTAITNFMDAQFYGYVQVGTPAQKLAVLFDTGSANLWFMSQDCYSLACYTHTVFNENDSSSFQLNGTAFSIQYGSGATTGVLGTDDVTVDSYVAKNVPIGIAKTVSLALATSQFDGIAGMGFRAISVDHEQTVPNDLVAAGDITDEVAQFYLTPNAGEQGSALVIGGIDSRYAAGEFQYVDLSDDTYFQIPVQGLSIGGQSTGAFQAIVDSGTSLLVGASDIVQPILNTIGTVSCSKISEYPDIKVNFGNFEISIPATDYVLQVEGECLLGVEAFPGKLPANLGLILGDVVMRRYTTAFDYQNKRVGFAPAAAASTL